MMLNITNNDWWILAIFILLIAGDKITTYLCVYGVENNFSGTDSTSIERNPMAKWLIDIFGNMWGNIIMAGCSLALMWLVLLVSKFVLLRFDKLQYLNTVIYCLIVVLAFAIGNNIFYALKYNKILT